MKKRDNKISGFNSSSTRELHTLYPEIPGPGSYADGQFKTTIDEFNHLSLRYTANAFGTTSPRFTNGKNEKNRKKLPEKTLQHQKNAKTLMI